VRLEGVTPPLGRTPDDGWGGGVVEELRARSDDCIAIRFVHWSAGTPRTAMVLSNPLRQQNATAP
jgi:hypothetical protein